MRQKCYKTRVYKLIVALVFVCGFFLREQSAFGVDDTKVKALSLYTIGVIHDLYGEAQDAVASYEQSAKISINKNLRLRLATDYALLGKFDLALDQINLLLAQDPQDVSGRYLLALIYTTQKKYDLAAKEYETILTSLTKSDPKNIEIYGYLAQLYYSQKKYDKAIKEFEIILSLKPNENADLTYFVGSLYLEVKDKKKALELFHQALAIDPDHDEALNSLGYLYADDGVNLDEAQGLIERALNRDPNNGVYLDSMGWVHFKKGNYDKALEYLKKADGLLKDPVIYDHLGDVYYKLGQKDNAKKFWNLSIKLHPDQQVAQKIKGLGSI